VVELARGTPWKEVKEPMLSEKQKIAHLLGELVPYALESAPQKVTITIEDLQDRIQITVEDVGAQRGVGECRQAAGLLNIRDQDELKDYYGGLAGEESLGPCDLRIVGMLVDGGQVEPRASGTRLTVWWKPE
jgi:hypothetical protein